MLKKTLITLIGFSFYPWNISHAALPECLVYYAEIKSMHETDAENRARLTSNIMQLLRFNKASQKTIDSAQAFYITKNKDLSELLKSNLEPDLKKLIMSKPTSKVISEILIKEAMTLTAEEKFAEACIVDS